ncbi:hypothetical protein B0T10DRAFT_552341 [Thelonectria olida]|uniref:Uncharacterized protein n=1 Tax=Thelonectria olida TaxID=1576542 RepID=A0A9P8VUZ4_9HYPO|nr:hypothetical protein B0T10DRAFT_552341 [Thelonectria olida]
MDVSGICSGTSIFVCILNRLSYPFGYDTETQTTESMTDLTAIEGPGSPRTLPASRANQLKPAILSHGTTRFSVGVFGPGAKAWVRSQQIQSTHTLKIDGKVYELTVSAETEAGHCDGCIVVADGPEERLIDGICNLNKLLVVVQNVRSHEYWLEQRFTNGTSLVVRTDASGPKAVRVVLGPGNSGGSVGVGELQLHTQSLSSPTTHYCYPVQQSNSPITA